MFNDADYNVDDFFDGGFRHDDEEEEEDYNLYRRPNQVSSSALGKISEDIGESSDNEEEIDSSSSSSSLAADSRRRRRRRPKGHHGDRNKVRFQTQGMDHINPQINDDHNRERSRSDRPRQRRRTRTRTRNDGTTRKNKALILQQQVANEIERVVFGKDDSENVQWNGSHDDNDWNDFDEDQSDNDDDRSTGQLSPPRSTSFASYSLFDDDGYVDGHDPTTAVDLPIQTLSGSIPHHHSQFGSRNSNNSHTPRIACTTNSVASNELLGHMPSYNSRIFHSTSDGAAKISIGNKRKQQRKNYTSKSILDTIINEDISIDAILGYLWIFVCFLITVTVLKMIMSSYLCCSVVFFIALSWIGNEFISTMTGQSSPLYWIRMVHASPIKHLGILGGFIGVMKEIWSNIVQPTIFGVWHDVMNVHPHEMNSTSNLKFCPESTGTIDRDFGLVVIGMLYGCLSGAGLGLSWWIIFGDKEKPSEVTKYLYRHAWRPLKAYYRISVRNGGVSTEQSNPVVGSPSRPSPTINVNRNTAFQSTTFHPDQAATTIPPSSKTCISMDVSSSSLDNIEATDELLKGHTKCAICLERFSIVHDNHSFSNGVASKKDSHQEDENDEPVQENKESRFLYDDEPYDNRRLREDSDVNLRNDPSKSKVMIRESVVPDRYQLLPCKHYFHRDCVCEWLSINKTCPVCRVPVQAILGSTQ